MIQFKSRSPSLITRTNRSKNPIKMGFTLIEVLVAAALGLVTITAVGTVIVQHIRTMTLQTVQLRFQDDFARASNFIENEVAEGAQITIAIDPDCTPAPGDLRFTIEVPVIVGNTGSFQQDLQTRLISYYQVPNAPAANQRSDIVRCGPPINPDGTLDVNGATDSFVLLTSARLNVGDQFVPPSQFVQYNIELMDLTPPGFSTPFSRIYPVNQVNQFVEARTKPNYIDN